MADKKKVATKSAKTSKKNKRNNALAEKYAKDTTKTYKNPASTIWGKIIICTLALLMLFSGLISLILILCK